MSLLNLEFLATTNEDLRYALEKNGHGRQKAFARDGLSMHTLLNVIKDLGAATRHLTKCCGFEKRPPSGPSYKEIQHPAWRKLLKVFLGHDTARYNQFLQNSNRALLKNFRGIRETSRASAWLSS